MKDIDDRIRGIVQAIAAAAPEPPPLPDTLRKPAQRRHPVLAAGLTLGLVMASFVGLREVLPGDVAEPVASNGASFEPLGSQRHQIVETTVLDQRDCLDSPSQPITLRFETWADFDRAIFRQRTTFPDNSSIDVLAFGDLQQPTETYHAGDTTFRSPNCPNDPPGSFAPSSVLFLNPPTANLDLSQAGEPVAGVDSLGRPALLYRPAPIEPGRRIELYVDEASGLVVQTVDISEVLGGLIRRTTVVRLDENAELSGELFDVAGFELGPCCGAGTVPTESRPDTGPSQSEQDALRDRVILAVAALSFEERVGELLRVETAEGAWVLSRMPSPVPTSLGRCESPTPDCIYGVDFVNTSDYAEVLLVDQSNRIIRAYPMPAMPPGWIYVDDEYVYVGRIGDGALPDSTLVRIHRQNLLLWGLVFRYDNRQPVSRGETLWAINSGQFPDWSVRDSGVPFLSIGSNEIGGVAAESWVGDVYIDLDIVRKLLVYPEDF